MSHWLAVYHHTVKVLIVFLSISQPFSLTAVAVAAVFAAAVVTAVNAVAAVAVADVTLASCVSPYC